ncbi:MAG: hypothetical protein AAF438_00165 [Pseudomonadota bacterium]
MSDLSVNGKSVTVEGDDKSATGALADSTLPISTTSGSQKTASRR